MGGVCPKCGSEIDMLIYAAYEFVTYAFTEQGYEFKESVDVDTSSIEYLCPKCRSVVARTEDEAKKIVNRE